MSTFAQFTDSVFRAVYTGGQAESLVKVHRLWVIDALIDLQRKISCLRVNHTDYIQPDQTLFSCGATLAPAPRGYIAGLYTLVPGSQVCQRIDYAPISKDALDCLMRENENCNWCADVFPYPFYGDAYTPYPVLPYGLNYPTPEIDRFCRATEGVFTIYRGNIWVYPSIQSSEIIALEWDGLKTTFSDSDILDDAVWDRETSEAVELYLRGKSTGVDDFDLERSEYFSAKYQIKVADLIHDCRKRGQLPPRNFCFHSCS